MLLDLGHEIAASAANLDKACELCRAADIDLVLLDLNLEGFSALPAAYILRERGIPFVFSTGYGAAGIPDEFASYPLLAKPFAVSDLHAKISRALDADSAVS
jgi:CheY-like chemotaxis protein